MQVVGGNSLAASNGLDELPSKTNYLGDSQATSVTNVPNYGQVEFQNVYAGVDLIYVGNQQQLEFNFTVAPGANPNAIALRFRGQDSISLDNAGDLVLHSVGGDVVEDAPVVYQMINGAKQTVAGAYVLQGGNQVGFKLASFDPGQPLVIDPVVVYSTYLGGSGNDYGTGVAVDSKGNTYVTGVTQSPDFPTTAGALQSTFNGGDTQAAPNLGGETTFVTKYDPSGQVVSSTYVGGNNTVLPSGQSVVDNNANAIAVDTAGNVYITGGAEISPSSFPSYVPFPTSPSLASFPATTGTTTSGFGAFVAELDTTLSTFVYSTYLPSAEPNDAGYGIAVDAAGNAYVAGITTFPTSLFQTPFAAKLDPKGNVLYDESFGNAASTLSKLFNDVGNAASAIAVDPAGNAYVVGWTDSANFGTLPTPQSAPNVGGFSAYVLKLDPQGAQSYLVEVGGGDTDTGIPGYNGAFNFATSVAVDAAGDAYVTGDTNSDLFPTVNPYQAKYLGNGNTFNAFVFKLDPTGTNLLYSTYLGGSGNGPFPGGEDDTEELNGGDIGNGIAIDGVGNAYVVGSTNSADFPIQNAVQPFFGQGTQDAFVTKLNASGSELVYSTFYSGKQADQAGTGVNNVFDAGNAIALDASGNVYIAGSTTSANFLTVNPAQAKFGGGTFTQFGGTFGSDAFVARIADNALIVTPQPVSAAIGQSFSGLVATFTAPKANLTVGDYTALIDWGDGSVKTKGVISQTGNPSAPYQVIGTHTYNTFGDYPIVITVTDTPDNLQATSGVDATTLYSIQTEPTIAINPTNPKNLFVAGSFGVIPNSGVGSYSFDGGVTWNPVDRGAFVSGNGAGGDGLPANIGGNFTASFDQFGNLYVTYLGADESGVQEAAIVWSTDGGKSFKLLAEYPGFNSDQPKVATGPGPTPGTASVVVSFTNDGNGRQVYLVGAVVSGPGSAPGFGLSDCGSGKRHRTGERPRRRARWSSGGFVGL